MELARFVGIFWPAIVLAVGLSIWLPMVLLWRWNWGWWSRPGKPGRSRAKGDYIEEGDIIMEETSDSQVQTQPSERSTERPAEGKPEAVGAVQDAAGEARAILAAYVELARALPGVVPELIGGDSLAQVVASVETSRAVYGRLVASVAAQGPGPILPTAAAPVPEAPVPGAGGGGRTGPVGSEARAANGPPAGDRAVKLIAQGLGGAGLKRS